MVVGVVILRNAWVCDDAYISFRTVDNFVNGYGLTWNTDERVQGFTNPLWVLLMSVAYAVTGDVYYTSILLSLCLTTLAIVYLVFKVSESPMGAVLSLAILIFSKAFIDYATSGLENPLTYLILALFFTVYIAHKPDLKTLFSLCLLASLGMLNRMDTFLIFIPMLAYAYFSVPKRRRLLVGIAGFAPFWLWELFAILYYGFPFPNTYYAKLHAGIPVGESIQQGLVYFVDTLHLDPLTLIVIFAAIVWVAVSRERRFVPVVIGVVLYLLYIIRIGGDFMSGRFFAAPLFCSALLVSRYRLPIGQTAALAPLAVVVLIGLTAPGSPLTNDMGYGATGKSGINARGIADERGWYCQSTGLLGVTRDRSMPTHEWMKRGELARHQKVVVKTASVIGFEGFCAGPDVHILDGYALTEPLLARLPSYRLHDWRIGHLSRTPPCGYLKTLEEGRNLILDPGVAEYYNKLSLITKGNLLSLKRLEAILKMNVGAYDGLLEPYLETDMIRVDYCAFSDTRPQGTPWNEQGNIIIRFAGLRIQLDSTCYCERIELSVDHNDHYWIAFCDDSLEISRQIIKREKIIGGGLRVDTVDVPAETSLWGYSHLEIYPYTGDDRYSVGHVRLLCEETE